MSDESKILLKEKYNIDYQLYSEEELRKILYKKIKEELDKLEKECQNINNLKKKITKLLFDE